MANTLGKILTLLFWLAAVYNLIAPIAGPASLWINVIAAILLIAHGVECVVFSRQIRRHHGNNLLAGYALVMLFGVLHTGQWLKIDAAAESE